MTQALITSKHHSKHNQNKEVNKANTETHFERSKKCGFMGNHRLLHLVSIVIDGFFKRSQSQSGQALLFGCESNAGALPGARLQFYGCRVGKNC